MGVLEFFVALRRRWRVIVIITAATMAIAWITTPSVSSIRAELHQKQYVANQKLLSVTYSRNGQWDRLALIATNGPIPQKAAEDLGAATVPGAGGEKVTKGAKQSATFVLGDAKAIVTIVPDATTGSLGVTCTSKNRELARGVCDGLTRRFIEALQKGLDQDYEAALSDKRKVVDDLNAKLDALGRQLAANTNPAAVREIRFQIDSARSALRQANGDVTALERQGKRRVDMRPLNIDSTGAPRARVVTVTPSASSTIPKTVKPRLAAGFLLGLLLGALVAFLMSRFDTSIFGLATTEAAARLPVLAEIPHVSTSRRRRFEVLTQLSPLSGVADAYRGLRTSIGLMWIANESEDGRNEPRTLIVASPGPNEGKSTTTANLAATYAEMGKRVIVIDLDFRRQRLHRFLGAHAEPHLENIGSLSDPRVDLDSVLQTTSIPGVRFVSSSSPDATPAEAAVAGRAAVLAARDICDIIIIDTPPLLLTNDTFDLLDLADAVLLLARDAKTKSVALTRAAQQLRRLDAPVLGVALIGAVSSRPGYGYGYGYGYQYGYSYGYGYGSRTGVKGASATAAPADTVVDVVAAETAEATAASSGPSRGLLRRGRRTDTASSSDDTDA